MNDTGYEEWLCELNGIRYKTLHKGQTIGVLTGADRIEKTEITLEILVKAMWAINRGNDYEITIDGLQVIVDGGDSTDGDMVFAIKDYNSEYEALNEALKYIYKEWKE